MHEASRKSGKTPTRVVVGAVTSLAYEVKAFFGVERPLFGSRPCIGEKGCIGVAAVPRTMTFVFGCLAENYALFFVLKSHNFNESFKKIDFYL